MLFRKEVVDQRKDRLYGHVLVSVPFRFSAITLFLLCAFGAAIAFLSVASFSRVETVRGAVIPQKGIVHIRSPSSGVLNHLAVREGERVIPDQILAQVNSASVASDQHSKSGAELKGIQSQIEQLEAQFALAADVERFKVDTLRQDEASVLQRGVQLEKLIELETLALDEAQSAWQRVDKLSSSGFASADAISQKKFRLIETQKTLVQYRADLADTRTQAKRLGHEIGAIKAQARLDDMRLEVQRMSLVERRDIILGTQSFDVRAPRAGSVTTLLSFAGQNVTAGQQLFSILPHQSTLEIELYVPSRAIGFVEPGQDVALLIDAFPFQTFGAQHGVVSSVTRSVILPDQAQLLVQPTEPVYRVKVTPVGDNRSRKTSEVHLQPGMLLTANIVLEQRHFFAWLFEPLISVLRRV